MKIHDLKYSLVFSFCLVLILSACGPSQAQIQVTQQIARTQTLAAGPTAMPKPTITQTPGPTPTPLYMNVVTIQTFLETGFSLSNMQYTENLKLLTVRYEGKPSNIPTALRIEVQYQTQTYRSNCLMPVVVISWGILSNEPVTVFPSSLKIFKVDCYSPTSDLLMSYQVTLADALDLVTANNLADIANSGKIYALQNNLPVVPNLKFAPNATPAPMRASTRGLVDIEPSLIE
jgi:hypothetical protein